MTEKDLSISIGVSRKDIKAARADFTEGVHWERLKSNRPEHLWEIQWTEQGVAALLAKFQPQPPDDLPAAAPELTLPKEAEGTITAKFRNPRILAVLIDGKSFNVLCRDSAKFGIGMPVKVRWDGAKWVVSKHPRFVGKY